MGVHMLHGLWDPPGPGIEPVTSALAGNFFFFLPLSHQGSPHSVILIEVEDLPVQVPTKDLSFQH